MVRIYANENFPATAIGFLRSLGHDVLTTYEAGNSNQSIPDEAVLSFASLEKRAVLTFNRKDFFVCISKILFTQVLSLVQKILILKHLLIGYMKQSSSVAVIWMGRCCECIDHPISRHDLLLGVLFPRTAGVNKQHAAQPPRQQAHNAPQ